MGDTDARRDGASAEVKFNKDQQIQQQQLELRSASSTTALFTFEQDDSSIVNYTQLKATTNRKARKNMIINSLGNRSIDNNSHYDNNTNNNHYYHHPQLKTNKSRHLNRNRNLYSYHSNHKTSSMMQQNQLSTSSNDLQQQQQQQQQRSIGERGEERRRIVFKPSRLHHELDSSDSHINLEEKGSQRQRQN